MTLLKDYLYFILIVLYAVVIGISLAVIWFITKVFLGIYSIVKGRFASDY